MGIVEYQVQRPSLREIVGLGLFFGLRPLNEHVIAYRDACSLSSLKVRGHFRHFMS